MSKLVKFWRGSRFFVILYAATLLAGMILTYFKFEFPIKTLATIWPILISIYIGLDRVVDIRTTQTLTTGQMSFGDLSKLRGIIFLCFGLFCASVVLTKIGKANIYEMDEFAVAFAMSIVLYVGGNKAVKSFKFSGPDKNLDGLPDKYEDEIKEKYEQWARTQRKNGVEEKFVTMEYFFDENPELKEKIR